MCVKHFGKHIAAMCGPGVCDKISHKLPTSFCCSCVTVFFCCIVFMYLCSGHFELQRVKEFKEKEVEKERWVLAWSIPSIFILTF